MLQYQYLYKNRLEKLRPVVKESASIKWCTNDKKKKINIVDNILDIKPF